MLILVMFMGVLGWLELVVCIVFIVSVWIVLVMRVGEVVDVVMVGVFFGVGVKFGILWGGVWCF